MKIDMLYFDGCPSWHGALEDLKTALVREGIEAEINLVRINDDAEAARMKFLGSPSFHIDGVELWAEQRDAYNLSCRLYATPAGMKGAPTVEMLQEKLRACM
jgi:hypothetical protein